MTASLETAHACLERAVGIKETAKALHANGDEWHAVCYFYAAYHTVKAAFIEDPIFDDAKALTAVSPFLIMGDRLATSHQGYIGGRGRKLGVNDIVKLIYPQIAAEYVLLHMTSIDVRYGAGLKVTTSEIVLDSYEKIIAQYMSGNLKGPLAAH